MANRVQPRLVFTLITDFVNIFALPHAPKGWEDIKLKYHRSDVYFGMVRSFTIPVSYVKDGAYILRKAFYGDPSTGRIGPGVQANVQLRVEKFNTVTYSYDIVYQGDNDFSTFQDHGVEDGDIVSIEIMDGGINKFVKAYEDAQFTIPIPTSGIDCQVIQSVPIKMKESTQFIIQGGGITESFSYFPGLKIVTNEQKALDASVQDVTFDRDNLNLFANGGKWFIRPRVGTKVKVTGTLTVDTQAGQALNIYDSSSTIVKQLFFRPDDSDPEFDLVINIDTSFSATQFEVYFLYVNSQSTFDFIIKSGDLKITYDTISPSTDIYAVSALYLYGQLLNKMAGYQPVPIQSNLLQQWSGLLLTSGQAIKPFIPSPIYSDTGGLVEGLVYLVYIDQITYNGHVYLAGQQFTATIVPTFSSSNPDAYVQQYVVSPTIITSFKDFFKSINAVLNAGFGVENDTAVLESKSYFYKYQLQPVSLGKVAKFIGGKPSIANLFSSVKYGFSDESYDQVNGADEFNSLAYVTLPIPRINKELDLTSVYRADSTGWELLRVGLNQDSQGSSSTAGNNDVWFAYCNSIGGNRWEQEQPSSFVNLIGLNTNLFNLRISPKENLLRHGDFLASILYGLNGEFIRFASGLKNVNISRISNGITITENSDIAIGDLPKGFFIPMEATITTNEPLNMIYILDMFPTGSLQFEVHSGIKINMFILDCNTDIPLNTPQEITGLYTVNNNLLECVR